MVRYKIRFTVTSEDLFRHAAKFIPVEDLHIEELVDVPMPPMPKAPPAVVAMANAIKARAAAKREAESNAKKPKRVMPPRGLNMHEGMNAAVMSVLRDGFPHKTNELIAALTANDYNPTSINSQLVKLFRHGYIIREAPGRWRKTDVQNTEETSRVERAINQLDPEGIPEA